MKNYTKLFALTILVCMPLTAVAGFDGRVKLDSSAWQVGTGGEFRLTPVAGFVGKIGLAADLPGSFQSFCVERSENVSFGGVYDAKINTKTVASNRDLTPEAAFLYYSFRTKKLPGYDYSSDPARKASAEKLQKAIWYAFGEGGEANSFYDLAYEATHLGKDGKITWKGIGPVRVLNLFNGPPRGDNNQDQLTVVPAPGAALLGAIGLTLVRWVKRGA